MAQLIARRRGDRRRAARAADRRRPDRLRLARPGPQPLAAADPDAVRRPRVRHRARDLRGQRAGAAGRGGRGVRLRRGGGRLAARGRAPGRRRRLHHRAEHAPPRADRGGRGGGQGHLLREAGRRHAGADRARGRAAARGGRDHGRRLQLPLGAARAVRRAADRRRPAGRDHQLPRPLLLDVRQRPAGPAVVALPARRGRPRRRRPTCSATRVDLAHMLLGPIARVVGTTETFIRERPLPPRPARTTGAAAPTTRRGPVTNEDYAGMLCEFASGARGTFEASRTIVGPESQMAFEVYGTRGRAELEPRAHERAAGLPGRGRAAHRLPHRVRRRALPATTATSSPAARTGSGSRTSW